MLTEREAKRQIARLAGLPRFETLGDAGAGELVRVLIVRCANSDHAERTVTAWLDGHRWLPAPAELGEIAEHTPERDNAAALQAEARRCGQCLGSGFARCWLLVTYVRHPSGEAKSSEERVIPAEVAATLAGKVDGVSQIVTDAVRACDCAYGQRLRAARVARSLEDAEKRQQTRGRSSR